MTLDPETLARIFTKYTMQEMEDFAVFYLNHFDGKEYEYARRRWTWARTDVYRRSVRLGVSNPLKFADVASPPIIAQDKARIESMRHADGKLQPVEKAIIGGAKELPTREQREALYASLEASSLNKGVFSPTQESTTLTVAQDAPVMIAFYGDIHSGGSIRYDLFKRDMEMLRDTEGMYAIGMGDYIDNFKPMSKAGNGLFTAAFADTRLQLAHVSDRMQIADGKWVALCQGNHDAWDYKYAGIDRLPDLARSLNAAYFSEAGGTVFAEIGNQRYVLVCKHQYSGNSKLNTTNNQRRVFDEFPQWENADVICLAHLHFNDLHQTARKGGSVTYLRTGTYKTEDEWAASHGYTPEYGVPSVILYPREHIVVPFRGDRINEAIQFFKFVRATYGR